MILKRMFILTTITACILFVFACKKDKAPKITVPEITTAAISSITATTAMSGGTITSNGGETISASGVCWSTTNQNPTISDDTTKGNTASGSFTAMLINLNSSSTYYVRAYAINRVGTAYGDVVTFNTGNGAPTATALSITGDAVGDQLLTATYTYSDPESDPEAGTTFQWYMADDATGTNEMAITNSKESTFRLQTEQEGKYIRVGVTAKSSAGNMNGVEVKSAFIGAVGEGSTVTFTYNGEQLTYGIINSAGTGKKWLDRNLGATRSATAIDDYQAYGHYFQWGRGADGHQLVNRTGPLNTDVTAVNGTINVTSDDDTSATSEFIIDEVNIYSRDWRTTPNVNLWQGVNGINNPCPTGWRIPTKAEWEAEGITTPEDAFTKLKMTRNGRRAPADGSFVFSGGIGFHWLSDIDIEDGTSRFSFNITIGSVTNGTVYLGSNPHGAAIACRCIKE